MQLHHNEVGETTKTHCDSFSDAFNEELIYQTLQDVLAGKRCEIPVYDYRTNAM